MNTLTLRITTKDKKIDLKVDQSFKAFSELFQYLKSELSIENDFDIFVKITPNQPPLLLTEANFKKDFILLNQNTVQLILYENPNLDSQIQSIITEYEHKEDSIEMQKENGIDDLSVFASDSKVIESQWINNGDINANPNSKPIKIFTDKCSCCLKELTSIKFICWICDECTFCEECELTHDHPVIKYKSLLLSKGIEELMSYKTVKEKNIINMFKMDIELTSIVDYKVTIQLKKEVTIPIQVRWNGNQTEAYTVIIKNYKDLHVKYTMEESMDNVSKLYVSFMPKMHSKAKYNIGVLINIKDTNTNSNMLMINLEVNEDKEDEELNEYFVNYPNIIILPKKYKQLIAMTFKEKLSGKSIDEIYAILKFHKWKIDAAIEDLIQDSNQ